MTRRCSVIFRPLSMQSFSSREDTRPTTPSVNASIHAAGIVPARRRLRQAKRSAALAAGAEADLPRERAALLRIIRRDHGVFRRQVPFLAVLLRREAIGGADMALQHLLLL